MSITLAMHDLASGKNVDDFGRPIPHSLTGQPPMMYALCAKIVENSIGKLLPTDFAEAFVAVRSAVYASAEEQL